MAAPTAQEPAMIVTVFRSRLRPGLQEEYVALVDRMQQIAKTIPGYISHKGFWSDDGERVTIVEFEHEEGQTAWRMHPEHLEAQKLGRTKYYEMYDIKVAQVTYHRHHERKTDAPAGA
jgi:heme-degrading monooxygenase HmoA